MLRKVSKIGPSTLMISLPSKWVRKLGIKKGQELDITEEGDSLRIRSSTTRSDDVVNIEVQDEVLLTRYLNSLYISGCDEIKINFGGGLNVSNVESLIEQLLGYEVVEHTGEGCKVKDVARSLNKEFDSVLRRMFLINITMGEEALAGITTNEQSKLQRAAQMERTNNKFANFCMRLLNKYGYPDPMRLHTMTLVVNELEKVADGYRDFCDHASDRSSSTKEIVGMLSGINKHFGEIQGLFYSFDHGKAGELTKKRRELYGTLVELATKKNTSGILIQDCLYILKVMAHLEYFLSYR